MLFSVLVVYYWNLWSSFTVGEPASKSRYMSGVITQITNIYQSSTSDRLSTLPVNVLCHSLSIAGLI